MPHNNAASRLLALLKKAKSIDAKIASANAWEQVLNTKDPGLLLSRLGYVMRLPAEIASALSNKVGTNAQVVRHIAAQFYTAFASHKFGDPWNEFAARIDAHMLNYLDLASSLLETQTKTAELPQGELEALRTQFDTILETVRNAEIPSRIKSYIVSQLHGMLTALDEYFITGAEPILERVEATIGRAYVDKEFKDFLTGNTVGKQFAACLQTVANAITIAAGLPQLAQAAMNLLGGPTP